MPNGPRFLFFCPAPFVTLENHPGSPVRSLPQTCTIVFYSCLVVLYLRTDPQGLLQRFASGTSSWTKAAPAGRRVCPSVSGSVYGERTKFLFVSGDFRSRFSAAKGITRACFVQKCQRFHFLRAI